jgi:ATPase subunit of ABC transporter with duplicated ATPase domains
MSVHVLASGVRFSYGPADVLRDCKFHLEPGWTGLVGANGSGKSTLLRLIVGQLRPDAGALDRGSATEAYLCPQEVERCDDDVRALARAWDRPALRLCSRLALEPEQIERWSTLSPGERKRWQLAAALYGRPDILCLDEPTNHLDVETRERVAETLARYRGVGVIVSHDRAFLDRLCGATLWVRDGRVQWLRGGYSEARAQLDAADDRALAERDQARKQQRKVDKQLAADRRRMAQASAQISTSARAKGPRDSDARSMLARGRAMNAAAAFSRRVSVGRRLSERAAAAVEARPIAKRRGRSLFVDFEPAPMRTLAALERPVLSAGPTELARDVRLVVARDTRARIAGPNGAGKSTLLGALLEALEPRRERVLHLPQEIGEAEGRAMCDELRALPAGERARVFDVAAALGLSPPDVLRSERPSAGELRKLRLSLGLARRAWILVLDEPTNHLDLPSIERLHAALEDYPGALLLVTHDDALAAATTDDVWRIGEGRVVTGGLARAI